MKEAGTSSDVLASFYFGHAAPPGMDLRPAPENKKASRSSE